MWWGYSREGGDVGVCPFCYYRPRPLMRQHHRYTKLQEVSKCRTNRNCNSILLTESGGAKQSLQSVSASWCSGKRCERGGGVQSVLSLICVLSRTLRECGGYKVCRGRWCVEEETRRL